nr:G2/M phase-specific E3 ubiquitin-protein ligase-like isoform X1 [Nothobranchius furzeri]
MKLNECKAVLLVITEHIEMSLFSSEEQCVTKTTQVKEDQSKYEKRYRHMEHPLASDSDSDEEPEVLTLSRQQTDPKGTTPVQEELQCCLHVTDLTSDLDVEMETFPPIRLADIELVEIKSTDSSIVTSLSPNKTSHMKWKRTSPQKLGLVVKDVICLPRELYTAQLEGQISTQTKRAGVELTSRITIDDGWSAAQMESRLSSLFQGQFAKRTGQNFSFTYLQCVQGSRVLFVPETPAKGWTGAQVLRICGHGPLYILSHHKQGGSVISPSQAAVVKRDLRLNISKEKGRQLEKCVSSRVSRSPEKLTLNLNTILRLFRVENTDGETHMEVGRDDVLRCALKEVRKPGFSFRPTPIISFSNEEVDDPGEALREFFRLMLLKLQQTCVFEGHPGRRLFTYDLTALDDRKYYEAGVLIGWSLAHGGPGPGFLHPALYQLMCGQSPSLENFNWRDIVDVEVQIRLQELHSCVDAKQLPPSLCDWVSCCGIPGIYSARSNEIPTIYSRLVKHCIYHRVASMISQFLEGLNSCGGLWDLVRSHWELFLPVMSSKEQRPLKLEEFKRLFTCRYSRPDSELRAEEEATVAHWENVLAVVGDGRADFSFEDLLIFITGADHLPSFGFPKPIALCFYSQEMNAADMKLPYTPVGCLELFLPRGVAETLDLLVLLSRALRKALDLHTDE